MDYIIIQANNMLSLQEATDYLASKLTLLELEINPLKSELITNNTEDKLTINNNIIYFLSETNYLS